VPPPRPPRRAADAEAALAELEARLDEVEAELKVRTDIMNVTSIVSEADKKGDILNVNEKFIEVSKYPRGADRPAAQHHAAPGHAQGGVQADVVRPSAAATSSAAWSRTAPRTARPTTSTR
jgi:hypothetical protein